MPIMLAHQGAGASWQALVVVICVLTAALFLLVVGKVVKVRDHNDLVLPLAGVVIISSLGTAQSDSLSDHVGWAIPVGVIALAGLLWAAFKPDDASLRSPITWVLVVVAALGGVVLQAPLSKSLHPAVLVFDASTLPTADDITISLVAPDHVDTTQGAAVTATSPVTLVVTVTGGSVGNQLLDAAAAPSDPEELGLIRILEGNRELTVQPQESCSPDAPCTTLTYVLDLEPGTHTVYAEFLTATGSTFLPSVFKAMVLEITAP